MSLFTIRVVDLIDMGFEFGMTPEDYPIFDEVYRDTLNNKILKHYWLYEIGQETDSMFKLSLNRKLNEIMPYYNQLYLSEKIDFNPLDTVDYTDKSETADTRTANDESVGTATAEETSSNEGVTNSTTAGKSRSVSSVTPQVQLSGDEDYAASAADVNSLSDVSGTATNNGTQNSTANSTQNLLHNDSGSGTIDRAIKGRQGNASDLLMIYRATFLNIDMQIIRELETLFMQVWDNGDEFTNNLRYNMNGSFGNVFGIL